MKKQLIIALALLLSTTFAFAQESKSDQPKFWFGPKVGLDLATPTIDQNQIESEVKTNYQFGFFLQFGRKFYIQPELYYAVQKEGIDSLSTNLNTVNSIKLPVMFGMRLFNLKVISGHIMAGPTASYIVSEKLETTNTNINYASDRKKFNLALQGGAGVDVIGFITLDVRYSVDLSDNVNAQFKSLSLNNGVNVTLGIKLR